MNQNNKKIKLNLKPQKDVNRNSWEFWNTRITLYIPVAFEVHDGN